MKHFKSNWTAGLFGLCMWAGCASGDDTETNAPRDVTTTGAAGSASPAATSGTPGSSTHSTSAAGGPNTAMTPATPAASSGNPRPNTTPPAQPPATPPARPMMPAPMPTPMVPPATPPGPDDGDPNEPIIAIPDLKCGPGALLGTGAVNTMIGGRGVHVAYPCNKHKGAPVTFILNLHGTMPTEEIKLYQVGYFAASNLVNSHNFITVAPKAIGSQWGRMDDGKDEPHLMEVIQWTYDTFKDFDIRAMWVGGHSWGAAYTASFGCKPELADKVKGLILMSGGGSASCQSKMSMIVTTAEGDGRMPGDQTTLATSHGCKASKTEMILMNTHTSWPECMAGYVHANYYMLGKEHATFMDADVVKSIADWIKLARL